MRASREKRLGGRIIEGKKKRTHGHALQCGYYGGRGLSGD